MSEPNTFDAGYLDEKEVRVSRDNFGRLRLEARGNVYEDIRVARAFPISAPDRNIAFQDAQGKQIAMIADMRRLDRESRRLLQQELEMVYFSTRILQVLDVRSRRGVTTWRLVTDRGTRTIYVKDRNDIRTLPDGRILMTDMHGIRYEVSNPEELDEESRRFLEAET
ncbi:MAG: DUF1854 domain-containing protein [Armatimonadota bacterium]|nr:DUF1854 domain-containing protein [Armatimonadota bacterium]